MKYLKSLLLVLALAIGASGQVCKSNQYDMFQWMAPQAGTMTVGPTQTNFNVVFPSSGTFYWVKGKLGYPWDVKMFDQNYVYDWATEQVWSDPTTYKNFEKPMPMMPRCVDKPATPGKLTTIKLTPADSVFDIHTSCTAFTKSQLGYVINEVWGDSVQTVAGLTAPTLTLSYRYNCDSLYSSCKDKETFAMQQGQGMVQWTHYTLQNGAFVQVNQTSFPQGASLGSVAPVHPCW